ncbi:hypothetical protein KKB44_01335 [Candidatus Micrarchaeota archaeon]|nr:hypothetical protein [Candidatus Micrarchaeota archaeon]
MNEKKLKQGEKFEVDDLGIIVEEIIVKRLPMDMGKDSGEEELKVTLKLKKGSMEETEYLHSMSPFEKPSINFKGYKITQINSDGTKSITLRVENL